MLVLTQTLKDFKMKKFGFILTNVFLFAAAYAGFYHGVENAKNVVIGLCWLSLIVGFHLSGTKDEKVKVDYAENRSFPNYVYAATDLAMLAILVANNYWFTALAVLFSMHLINDTLEQVKKIKNKQVKAQKQAEPITF